MTRERVRNSWPSQAIAANDLPYFLSDQYDLGMEYIGYTPRESRIA
jgi:hypothetical protein